MEITHGSSKLNGSSLLVEKPAKKNKKKARKRRRVQYEAQGFFANAYDAIADVATAPLTKRIAKIACAVAIGGLVGRSLSRI